MIIYADNPNFDKSIFAGCSCAFGVFDGVHRGHRWLIDQAICGVDGADCQSASVSAGGVGGADCASAGDAGGADCQSASAGVGGAGVGKSVVLTFDRDPDEIFGGPNFRKLLSNEERLAALDATGVDAVVVLPFDEELRGLSPKDFLDRTFAAGAPAQIHVGTNLRFGARAAGGIDELQAWGQANGCEVFAHDLVCEGGEPISATRIRGLLAQGAQQQADALLK